MKSTRVFVNSLPKSGTHLLIKAIELFGYPDHCEGYADVDNLPWGTPSWFNYQKVHQALARRQEAPTEEDPLAVRIGTLSPVYVNPATMEDWLAAMPQGSYITGHILWSSQLKQILKKLDYNQIFIFRDPRAVIPSLLAFIIDARFPGGHFLEADFKLMTPAERLTFILKGGYAPQAKRQIEPFSKMFLDMIAWQKDPNCLTIRFEDLVGEQGGGTRSQQQQTIQAIANHLNCPFDNSISNRSHNVYDKSAVTFRQGQIDGWKRSFDPNLVEQLVEYCKPLCHEAGYE